MEVSAHRLYQLYPKIKHLYTFERVDLVNLE